MSIVLKSIEAFPTGRTTAELFALLDVDFDANARVSIRAELAELGQQGIVRLGRDGKWRLTSRSSPPTPANPKSDGPSEQVDDALDVLIAAAARFRTVVESAEEFPMEPFGDECPDPQALLRYYRAAVRADPRGALTQTLETYGISHVLLAGDGSPWPEDDAQEGQVRISLESLPDRFREALKRRESNENALAIGWPISIGVQRGVPILQPVGLIAGEWEHQEEELVVHIAHSDILVNPDWIRRSARDTAWRASDLTAVFRTTEGVGLSKDDFTERLREAQASTIRGRLSGVHFVAQIDPMQHGIHDGIGLFLPTETTFTSGAVKDLDQIATWSADQYASTALAPLLEIKSTSTPADVAPINLGPVNLEQYEAIKAAMSQPLTVVTGPPGTGKSQAIVAMAATALQAGETVLVASKNHQALDAVEERLTDIAPGAKFLVRTLDPSKDIDKSVRDVLGDIVNGVSGAGASADPELQLQLEELARQRMASLETLSTRRQLHWELADLVERRDLRSEGSARKAYEDTEEAVSWFVRLLRALRLVKKANGQGVSAELELGLNIKGLDQLIAEGRASLDALGTPDDPLELTERITALARSVVARTLSVRSSVPGETRAALQSTIDDQALHGDLALPREIIEAVVGKRPLWLASVLGAPRRIPLHQGLFDLAIFDEASQCDIGTALPLFARARRAVVVGDDRQLAFISQIGAAQDRNLMAAQGLPTRGMGRFAQSLKSLFDLASSTPAARKIMLRDQYRSAPDIVDYISSSFYGSKLRASADLGSFRTPRDTKPGISWTHVAGRNAQTRAGNVNDAEVDAIRRHLSKILIDDRFDGSVSVITPFRAQAFALEQALKTQLPEQVRTKAEFRVATVDSFQGQERDVVIFSPVVHAASPASAVAFIQRDWRRLNVAISRARAACHIFGDLTFAKSGKIRTLGTLAARATEPKARSDGETVFDSRWERIVYYALRERGLDPVPQYEIAGRRLDFALFAGDIKLDLEVDGRRWHQDIDGNRKPDDIWRDHQMKSLGWRVRRFWVDELSRNLEDCLDLVQRDLS